MKILMVKLGQNAVPGLLRWQQCALLPVRRPDSGKRYPLSIFRCSLLCTVTAPGAPLPRHLTDLKPI